MMTLFVAEVEVVKIELEQRLQLLGQTKNEIKRMKNKLS
jgi:hypothetical protein